MRKNWRELICSERGVSLVEYALLVALIALLVFVGVRTLGLTVSRQLGSVGTAIQGAPEPY